MQTVHTGLQHMQKQIIYNRTREKKRKAEFALEQTVGYYLPLSVGKTCHSLKALLLQPISGK